MTPNLYVEGGTSFESVVGATPSLFAEGETPKCTEEETPTLSAGETPLLFAEGEIPEKSEGE